MTTFEKLIKFFDEHSEGRHKSVFFMCTDPEGAPQVNFIIDGTVNLKDLADFLDNKDA
jgi:hypothetical protein